MRNPLAGLIDLDPALPEPLHLQLARQIKQAVLEGNLGCAQRLPSSRTMAADLRISRNTVLVALDQLIAEGYLTTRRGSGTHVADFRAKLEDGGGGQNHDAGEPEFKHTLARHWQKALAQHKQSSGEAFRPFRPGAPDVAAFPHDLWAASLRRAARALEPDAARYGQMSGHPRLRAALAAELAETRGVVADADQIIITASARGAISLLVSALIEPGDHALLEEPGFNGPKTTLDAAGAKLIPVEVDDNGLNLGDRTPHAALRLIYTTPSHQYPTGAMMSLKRRLDLIDFAARSGAYIIEDDYDSEFQYRGRPIAALQGLDRVGCVIYLGTVSKNLLPGLRMGFIVAPKPLAALLIKVHRNTGQFVSQHIQLAAADFIERGHYRAHIRKMRGLYAKRLSVFAEQIHKQSGNALNVTIPDCGLQTVITSRNGLADAEMVKRFAKAGIDCHPLCDFHLEPEKARHRGVLMSFSAWDEGEIRKALSRLKGVF